MLQPEAWYAGFMIVRWSDKSAKNITKY